MLENIGVFVFYSKILVLKEYELYYLCIILNLNLKDEHIHKNKIYLFLNIKIIKKSFFHIKYSHNLTLFPGNIPHKKKLKFKIFILINRFI